MQRRRHWQEEFAAADQVPPHFPTRPMTPTPVAPTGQPRRGWMLWQWHHEWSSFRWMLWHPEDPHGGQRQSKTGIKGSWMPRLLGTDVREAHGRGGRGCDTWLPVRRERGWGEGTPNGVGCRHREWRRPAWGWRGRRRQWRRGAAWQRIHEGRVPTADAVRGIWLGINIAPPDVRSRERSRRWGAGSAAPEVWGTGSWRCEREDLGLAMFSSSIDAKWASWPCGSPIYTERQIVGYKYQPLATAKAK